MIALLIVAAAVALGYAASRRGWQIEFYRGRMILLRPLPPKHTRRGQAIRREVGL